MGSPARAALGPRGRAARTACRNERRGRVPLRRQRAVRRLRRPRGDDALGRQDTRLHRARRQARGDMAGCALRRPRPRRARRRPVDHGRALWAEQRLGGGSLLGYRGPTRARCGGALPRSGAGDSVRGPRLEARRDGCHRVCLPRAGICTGHARDRADRPLEGSRGPGRLVHERVVGDHDRSRRQVADRALAAAGGSVRERGRRRAAVSSATRRPAARPRRLSFPRTPPTTPRCAA